MKQRDLGTHTRQIVTLAGIGNFLALWSTFEIILEMLIMRELRLSAEEASIVCTPKAVDAKMTLLEALLRRDPANAEGISLLRSARVVAERNNFTHGFFRVNRENGDLYLVNRQAKNQYSASSKHLDHKKMDDHAEIFSQKFLEVKRHFGISDEDVDAYTQPIFDLAQVPKEQKPRRRRGRSA